MYGDAAGAQVVDAHDTAYDVPAKVVEDEDLPYGLAVVVDDGRSFREEAVGLVGAMVVRRLDDVFVEVEDLLD
jgi:hypothetical protein